jgi:hypothetical protein
MSTYFESIMDDGSTVQITDNYESMCVKRTGSFSANHNNGYVTCVALEADEIFVGFRCENAILYISPIVSCGGKRVCYVTCSNDSVISYFTASLYASIMKPSTSSYGLEIYDASGNVVFSSNQQARSTIIDHQHINCSVRDLGSNNQLLYTQSNVNWGNYAIADNGHRYVVSYESPWQTPAVSTPLGSNYGWKSHVYINAAGYDFSNGQIKTQAKVSTLIINTVDSDGVGFNGSDGIEITTCTMRLYHLQDITGNNDGDWTQLQSTGLVWIKEIMIRYGITCLDYDFNVVDLLK